MNYPDILLYMICTFTFAFVTNSSLQILKLDAAIQPERGFTSVMRKTTVSAGIGCFGYMVFSLFNLLAHSIFIEQSQQWIFAGMTIGSLAAIFLYFAIFSFTLQIVSSMALAESGVAGTRIWWLVMINQNLILVCVALVFILCILSLVFGLYCLSSFYFLIGISYGALSSKFLTLSQVQASKSEQHCISQRCKEIHRVTLSISVNFVLLTVIDTLLAWSNIDMLSLMNPAWAETLVWGVIMFVILRDIARLTKRRKDNYNILKIKTEPSIHVKNRQPNQHQGNGVLVTDAARNIIGKAPAAPRPAWLPTSGGGQARLPPLRWSISIGNWIKFFQACMDTDTWSYLAEVKGEENITMHDIVAHFVKPWTRGTGCSIAGLLDDNQAQIETMVSHSYDGSVKETFCSVQSLVSLFFLPKDARIFFCTLCLYHPQDGVECGLSIQQQLNLKPFAKIIELKPRYGMFLIHTTLVEVLNRLWCVHEVDEAVLAGIKIFGAIDTNRWTEKQFDKMVDTVCTRNAVCQDQDREMLTNLIQERGGFDRLDKEAVGVRKQAKSDLLAALSFQQLFSMDISSIERIDQKTPLLRRVSLV